MNEKLKIALSDENLWFPNVTKVAKKSRMERKTAEYQIKQARKKGEITVSVDIDSP